MEGEDAGAGGDKHQDTDTKEQVLVLCAMLKYSSLQQMCYTPSKEVGERSSKPPDQRNGVCACRKLERSSLSCYSLCISPEVSTAPSYRRYCV